MTLKTFSAPLFNFSGSQPSSVKPFVHLATETARPNPFVVITVQKDDRTRQGVWTPRTGGTLVFADAFYDRPLMSTCGGAVAGAVEGHPVQLIYWGSWWDTGAGQSTRGYIDAAFEGLLQSPYFDGLKTYGVVHPPIWRPSVVVSGSEPDFHRTGEASSTFTTHCGELVEDLLDNNAVPSRNGGPRVCYLVVLPPGFAVKTGDDGFSTGGAHDYEFDFPFLKESFWYGWCVFDPDTDAMVRVLGHELVEIMTDAAGDAWRFRPPLDDDGHITEVGDGAEGLTAWVGGASAQAYWDQSSLNHIIPLDHDYCAQLTAAITETARTIIHEGIYRPGPEESAACSPSAPSCCFGDEDYVYRLYAVDEIARVRLRTRRYKQPVVKWFIGDVELGSEGEVTIAVDTSSYADNRDVLVGREQVRLRYKTLDFRQPANQTPLFAIQAGLDISTSATACNFSVPVKAFITESAFSGPAVNPPDAAPQMTVDFVCADMLFEDAYIQKKSRCFTELLSRYIVQYKPTGRPGQRDPVNEIVEILGQTPLPAYVRPSRRTALEQVKHVARAAHAVLEPDHARAFVRGLIKTVPELQLAHALTARRPPPPSDRARGLRSGVEPGR